MAHLENFSFRKADVIGAADAADDRAFLDKCFVDTGVIQALQHCKDPRRIVLGRTGTGKTALLAELAHRVPNPISISPESLSIPYIANSNLLTFLHKIGVKLDVFFKLLWRHVLVVEILKSHFKVAFSADKNRMLDRIMEMLPRDPRHNRAIQYLEKWGSSFWLDTDRRIKEIAEGLETQLKGSAGLNFPPGQLTAELSRTWSQQQITEVVERAQSVVNSVQIRELTDIIRLTNGTPDH